MIISIVLIKYKPMYHVKIGNKEIGYIEEKQNIKSYVEEIINSEQNENIAFIEMSEEPMIEYQLVSRDTSTCDEELKKVIKENLSIEYTTYAITCNGSNIAYVSTMEEAEKIIEDIKGKYSLQDTKSIGVLQVYSDNYNEIKATNLKNATKKVAKVVDKTKKSTTVKVAKTVEKGENIAHKANANGIKFTVKPLSGVITSRYGGRRSPGGIGSTNHKGLDISAKSGTTIKATASGIVKFAGYKGSLGNLVIIDNGSGVETYYGHCSKLYVKKGQKVAAGNKIAAVGQTGAATGPHLHFEVHVNGTAVNPQRYIY